MPFSDYTINLLADWLKGTSDFPAPPSAIYVDLFVGDPTSAGTGGTNVTTQVRASGAVSVTFGDEANNEIANSAIVDFGNTDNQVQNISHFALFDAPSGVRNQLYQGALPSTRTYAIGDPVLFAIGEIAVSMSGGMSAYVREKIFDWLKNVAAFPAAPTNIYDAFFNGNPLDTGTGGTETTSALDSTNGRLPITLGTLSNKTLSNSAIVDHGMADADATVDFVAVYDAQTGGNQLAQAANGNKTNYTTGDAINIPVGALAFKFVSE